MLKYDCEEDAGKDEWSGGPAAKADGSVARKSEALGGASLRM